MTKAIKHTPGDLIIEQLHHDSRVILKLIASAHDQIGCICIYSHDSGICVKQLHSRAVIYGVKVCDG